MSYFAAAPRPDFGYIQWLVLYSRRDLEVDVPWSLHSGLLRIEQRGARMRYRYLYSFREDGPRRLVYESGWIPLDFEKEVSTALPPWALSYRVHALLPDDLHLTARWNGGLTGLGGWHPWLDLSEGGLLTHVDPVACLALNLLWTDLSLGAYDAC